MTPVKSKNRKNILNTFLTENPIHAAAFKGHTKTVKALLSKDTVFMLTGRTAIINTPDTIFGSTPIHYAAAKGHIDTIKLLIKCTANANVLNNYGSTPIHWAAKYGHTEIVKVLIEVTANPNAPNISGMTPYELA